MRIYQYARTLNPYLGVAESALTSNVVYTGDAAALSYSIVTSSATASRWTAQGNNGDGFFAALNANEWMDLAGRTAQGFYSVDTIPRWLRFQRAPSNSSTTFTVSYRVGP